MAFPVANMLGIRTGGVFSGETDMNNLRERIVRVATECDADSALLAKLRSGDCISTELEGGKGTLVIIGGIFNYVRLGSGLDDFAMALSAEFSTEVMVMSHTFDIDEVRCQLFLAGKPLLEVSENPIGRILRRIT